MTITRTSFGALGSSVSYKFAAREELREPFAPSLSVTEPSVAVGKSLSTFGRRPPQAQVLTPPPKMPSLLMVFAPTALPMDVSYTLAAAPLFLRSNLVTMARPIGSSFLTAPWPVAAASFGTLRSSYGMVLVSLRTFAIYKIVPEWIGIELMPKTTSARGLPSVSMVPATLPFAMVMTPVANSPRTSFAYPLVTLIYTGRLAIEDEPPTEIGTLENGLVFAYFVVYLVFGFVFVLLLFLG